MGVEIVMGRRKGGMGDNDMGEATVKSSVHSVEGNRRTKSLQCGLTSIMEVDRKHGNGCIDAGRYGPEEGSLRFGLLVGKR